MSQNDVNAGHTESEEAHSAAPASVAGLQDRGPQDRAPERTCIVTREVLPKEALLRFVLGPEGQLVPDVAGKLPGRGCWVKLDRHTIQRAVAQRAFARGLKAPVRVGEDLEAQILRGLEERVISALSLSRRAGQVVTGFEKARSALESGNAIALLHAEDAGADGLQKLEAARSAADDKGPASPATSAEFDENNDKSTDKNKGKTNAVPVFQGIGRALLGQPFGREQAVHIVLLRGGMAEQALLALRRWAGFSAKDGV